MKTKAILMIGAGALMVFVGFKVHAFSDSVILKQQAIANQVLTEALAQ